MANKYYFMEGDNEICYSLDYFKNLLEFEKLDELKLFEAERVHVEGYFWCRFHEASGEKSEGGCGKCCVWYIPRNGKSGCCVNYSTRFYEPNEKFIIIKRIL